MKFLKQMTEQLTLIGFACETILFHTTKYIPTNQNPFFGLTSKWVKCTVTPTNITLHIPLLPININPAIQPSDWYMRPNTKKGWTTSHQSKPTVTHWNHNSVSHPKNIQTPTIITATTTTTTTMTTVTSTTMTNNWGRGMYRNRNKQYDMTGCR